MGPGSPPLSSLTPRLSAAACTVVVLSLLMAAPSSAAAPAERPDSHHQPLLDGCQRSNAMDLTLTTPEWVYVNRSEVLGKRLAGDQTAGRQTVEGVVADIHPAGDDLYVNHDYNDVDIDVTPDPGSANLVATGNGGDLGTEW